MTQPSTRELGDAANAAARLAGDGLARSFRRGGLEIEAKAKHDFVSSADRQSEMAIVRCLKKTFPDHEIVTEEAGVLAAPGRYRWIIDPLDGTTNYLMGLPFYCVSIACQRDDETCVAAIYDPQERNLFSAAKGHGAFWNNAPIRVSSRGDLEGAFLATGFPFKSRAALPAYLKVFADVFESARAVRRCGAAALDLAYTAAGVFDGFFEFKLAPWDVAAGALLIEEAGGAVSDLDGGSRYLETGNILAGTRGVRAALQRVVSRHASERTLAEVP